MKCPDDELRKAWDHERVHARNRPRPGAHRFKAFLAVAWAATWLGLPIATAAHGAVPPDPPDALNLLFGWNFEPAVVLPLLGAAIVWWRLLDAVDRAHPDHPVPALQRWCFLGGLAVIALALDSGVARYDTTLFSVHMVQHVLLALVAPPLLVLGAPITQLLRASSSATRNRWILPVLQSHVVRFFGHPVVAGLFLAGVMWATHFSPLFDRALEDPLAHEFEHALYLVAGILFWMPAIGLDPAPSRMGYPARIAYIFLQMPQNSFLAMAILFADAPLYAHYATLGSPYGIDALADQRLAAGIMWFVGDVIFLIAMLGVLAAWMRSEERGSAAAERRADVERAAIRERETVLRDRRAKPAPQDQTAVGAPGPEPSTSER